jgi:hypothetical protein
LNSGLVVPGLTPSGEAAARATFGAPVIRNGGTLRVVEQLVHELIAIDDPPDVKEANPIHGAGAQAVGYDRPIVAGVSSYAWAIGPAIELLGDEWFERGWAEYSLRRPVFVGDGLRAIATPSDPTTCDFVLQGADDKAAVEGRAGLGVAPWEDEWLLPARRDPTPAVQNPPLVLPEDVPADGDLPPMALDLSADDAAAWASVRLGDSHPRYQVGPGQRVHPSWAPCQYVYLVRHSCRQPDVGIHVSGRVQNRHPIEPSAHLVIAGRWTMHERRKERWWSAASGLILDDAGTELTYFSQVAILLPPFDLR